MNPNQQALQPGQALGRLLLIAAFTGFLWWLASQPGWEAVWIAVVVGAGGVLTSLRELVQAHRAWKERRAVEELARRLSDTYTTGGRWERGNRGDHDQGWP